MANQQLLTSDNPKQVLAQRLQAKMDELVPLIEQAQAIGLLVETHTTKGWKEHSAAPAIRVLDILAATGEESLRPPKAPESNFLSRQKINVD